MSAFTIFEDESIDELLQACESLCKTAENGARLSCNMLRRNTVGLRYKHDVLIEEFLPAHSSLVQCKPKPIRSQIIGGVSNFSMHYDMQHDDSDRPGKYDAINLVGDGRYGVVKRNQRFGDTITANPLGTGQFSSVFNAIDMYTYGSKQSISVQQHEAPATLAIKIVDRKFKILALREIAFLKFINYRHSGSYCKQTRCSFAYSNVFCGFVGFVFSLLALLSMGYCFCSVLVSVPLVLILVMLLHLCSLPSVGLLLSFTEP